MIKSMTAYSRASMSTPLGRFVIEIHSVNRKMLDISLYLPKDLLRFDIDMRRLLSQYLERGQITLRFTWQNDGVGNKFFANSSTQLRTLKEGWEKVASELGYDPGEMIDLPFLVSQLQAAPFSESKEDVEILKKGLKEAVETGLQELMQMKETEGQILALDIEKRLKIIEESLVAIELKKEVPLLQYRKKLIERLKEIGQLHAEAEERIAREVVILAERMDVTEELVRLRSHIVQFRQYLLSKEKAVGRTLDFLTQEMHREVNTLGSKVSDSEISSFAVKIKSELDKIREQVQNIE